MADQVEMFFDRSVELEEPTPPAQQHSATSRAAARDAKSWAHTTRGRVYAMLRARLGEGATDEEIQTVMKLGPSTQRPRRIELVNQGLVVDSGRTRPTRSGRRAVVWVAVEPSEVA